MDSDERVGYYQHHLVYCSKCTQLLPNSKGRKSTAYRCCDKKYVIEINTDEDTADIDAYTNSLCATQRPHEEV